MKNTFFHVSRAAALTVCAFATSQMQAAFLPKISVTVPFDFVVGGKTLPAGNYSIMSTNSNGAPIFLVRNEATRKGSIALMTGRSWPKANESKPSQVVFACRADTCFLSGLEIRGWDGYMVPLPKLTPAQQERQVALDARFVPTGK